MILYLVVIYDCPLGRGDEGTIKERVEQLKEQIADTSSDYEREKLEERLAKLSDGVAVLKVGRFTDHVTLTRDHMT